MVGNSVNLQASLVVEDTGQGLGVFAKPNFQSGDRLVIYDAKFSECASKYTIQLDIGKHLLTDRNLGAFINHSCDPNASFSPETLEIIAVKPIQVGDQVTFNYLSSEWDMASPFDCNCGSDRCKGHIQGFRYLSNADKNQLEGVALPYLYRVLSLT